MIILYFIAAGFAIVYFWRLAWFVVLAVAVPLATAAAWCAGAASGWWRRWHNRNGGGLTPGGEGQPARPRAEAEVIDLAARRGRTRQRH